MAPVSRFVVNVVAFTVRDQLQGLSGGRSVLGYDLHLGYIQIMNSLTRS